MEICEGCGARAEPGEDFKHDEVCQARVPDVVCGQKLWGGAICTSKRPCDEHDIARARHILHVAVGYINACGVGDTLIGQAQRAARRVAELGELANKLAHDRDDAKKRAEAHSASIAKMSDERALLIRTAEESAKVGADALTSRDALFLELQAIREATMIEPPNADWAKVDAAHVRQWVQDLGDQRDRALRERDDAVHKQAADLDAYDRELAKLQAENTHTRRIIEDKESAWCRAAGAGQLVDIATPEQLAVRIADLLERLDSQSKEIRALRIRCEQSDAQRDAVQAKNSELVAMAQGAEKMRHAAVVAADIAIQQRDEVKIEQSIREWRAAANAGSLTNIETPAQLRERITVDIRALAALREDVSKQTNAAVRARKELEDRQAELMRCIKERDEFADELSRGADPAAVAAGIEKLGDECCPRSVFGDGEHDADCTHRDEEGVGDSSSSDAIREAVVYATADLMFEWMTGEKPPGSEED